MMDEAQSPAVPRPTRARKPFGGKKRLYNIVKVRFKGSFLSIDYDAQVLDLERGDIAVVETTRGPAIAEIFSEIERSVLPAGSLKKILRLANDEDHRIEQANLIREREAFRFALERLRARNLSMKLIQVQYMHDGSKAIFYFSAEGRIDFRELVRDLANRFRTRIEMRQIGVRDGARMVGGIGSCGRELCCSTFLSNFAPVSIRMAKDQGLTLNPKKVSGMCGRLMCCLVYEQHIYRKTQKRLPRAGKIVETARGLGVIRTVDVVQEVAGILLDDGQFDLFPAREIVVLTNREAEQRRGGNTAAPSHQDLTPTSLSTALNALQDGDDEPWLWEDEEGANAEHADSQQSAEAPRRARRRSSTEPRQGAEPRKPSTTEGKPSGAGRGRSSSRPPGAGQGAAPRGDRRPRDARRDAPPAAETTPTHPAPTPSAEAPPAAPSDASAEERRRSRRRGGRRRGGRGGSGEGAAD